MAKSISVLSDYVFNFQDIKGREVKVLIDFDIKSRKNQMLCTLALMINEEAIVLHEGVDDVGCFRHERFVGCFESNEEYKNALKMNLVKLFFEIINIIRLDDSLLKRIVDKADLSMKDLNDKTLFFFNNLISLVLGSE